MNRSFKDSYSPPESTGTDQLKELDFSICGYFNAITETLEIYTPQKFHDSPRDGLASELAWIECGLDDLETKERDFIKLSGHPHASYDVTRKKQELLISRIRSYLDYRGAQRVWLN